MAYFRYVEEDPGAEPDHVANSGITADPHAALRACPGRLSFPSAAERSSSPRAAPGSRRARAVSSLP